MEPRTPYIAAFHRAVISFATSYFGLSVDEAEARMDNYWYGIPMEETLANHPFFIAGRLGDCEEIAIRKKYLVHHREISHVWLAPV